MYVFVQQVIVYILYINEYYLHIHRIVVYMCTLCVTDFLTLVGRIGCESFTFSNALSDFLSAIYCVALCVHLSAHASSQKKKKNEYRRNIKMLSLYG